MQPTFSKAINTLVLACFLPSCVSTHVGEPKMLTQMPVNVSCAYSPELSTKAMSGIICTLENQSHTFQDLKIRTVRFPDQTDSQIVSADDMRSLAEAFEVKKSREDHNLAMALGGLFLVGVAVAAGSHHIPTQNVGEAVMLGSTTAAVAHEVKQDHDAAQYGPTVYGRDHLLSGNLRIPPDLSIRRQVVINHPTEKPRTIEICWDKPEAACNRLQL